MKYKVGDKVIVRKDLEAGKVYDGINFVRNMEKFKGKKVTIKEIDSIPDYYVIDGDDNRYWWNDEMFEDINIKSPKYKVGDKVKLKQDLVVGKTYKGIEFLNAMEEDKNKILTIQGNVCENCYFYDVEESGFTYSEEMLEDIKDTDNEQVILIACKINSTGNIYYWKTNTFYLSIGDYVIVKNKNDYDLAKVTGKIITTKENVKLFSHTPYERMKKVVKLVGNLGDN